MGGLVFSNTKPPGDIKKKSCLDAPKNPLRAKKPSLFPGSKQRICSIAYYLYILQFYRLIAAKMRH